MRAVILDMYGVIVKQTGDDFVPYVHRHFPERGMEIYDHWLEAEVGRLPPLEIWRRIGCQGDDAAMAEIERGYLDTIEPSDGLYPFLEAAGRRYRLGLISNDIARWSRYIREKLDLDRYFGAVSVSGQLGIKKPDPRIYLLTASKLGVAPEECLFVDDRRSYLTAARSVGMEAVLFNTRSVEYAGPQVRDFDELSRFIGI